MHRTLLCLALAAASVGVPDSAQARRLGALEFQPCELGPRDGAVPVRGECATLAVPENPQQPQDRQISLRIGWLPARSTEPLPDPVFFFAGGPGQAATEAVSGILPGLARLREKRHIVFFDQRGTGGSNGLPCAMPESLDFSTPGSEQMSALVRACLADIGERADVRYYATHHAVHDTEAVRRAIGAPQINLYGGSYGTRAAQEYLRRYPGSVRSVMLDGVVPPELALGSEHARNLDETVSTLLGRCREQPDCNAAFGDPWQTLQALRERWRRTPMGVTFADPLDQRRQLTQFREGHLATVVRMFAYAPETAALLPLLLHEAAQGRPEPLLAQSAMIARNLGGQIALGMHFSVSCSEDADRLRVQPEDATRLMGNQMAELFHSQCALWPHAPRPADFNAPLASEVPMLLLSGELDPVTPPRYGEQVLAGKAKARHLVGPGQGHILLNRGCTPKLAATFLDNLDPAGLDATCLDVLGPTPFFLSFNGAAP